MGIEEDEQRVVWRVLFFMGLGGWAEVFLTQYACEQRSIWVVILDALDQDDDGDLNNMNRLSNKRKSEECGEGAENCGMQGYSCYYNAKGALRSTYNQEFAFCEKVKERVQSPDQYPKFLKF